MTGKIRDCLYGASGTGKSEACARVIEHTFRTTGQRARIVIGDGSALTYQYLVDMGVADLYEFTMRPWPTATLKGLARGWWPDPTSGKLAPTPAETMAQIGVYVFEGMSTAARYVMGHSRGGMADRAARGERLGPDASMRIIEGEVDPKTGKVLDGTGETYGSNGQAHYGFVQNTVLEVVQESHMLPASTVLWTAHEATNNPENDLNKELVIGPEIIGKAMTANIQRVFTNTLHFCTVAKRAKQTDTFTGRAVDELDLDYRIYTRDHFAPSGATMTRYKALTRAVDASQFPQYLGGAGPGEALLTYYAQLDQWTKNRAAQLTAALQPTSEGRAAGARQPHH